MRLCVCVYIYISYCEVEELSFLLVGTPLGKAGLVQVSVRHAGLDGLRGRAVGEALGHIGVVQHRHVLQGGQCGAPSLLHLAGGEQSCPQSHWKRDVCPYVGIHDNV